MTDERHGVAGFSAALDLFFTREQKPKKLTRKHTTKEKSFKNEKDMEYDSARRSRRLKKTR